MPLKNPIKPAGHEEKFEPGTPAYERQNAARQAIVNDSDVDRNVQALSRISTGHVKKWDPVTAGNLARVDREMSIRPPKAGWVVVLHPWIVSVNGGRLVRDKTPPAALEIFEDGKLLIHRHRTQGEGEMIEPTGKGIGVLELPWYEPDLKPEENGSYTVTPIMPIEQAAEYAREANSNDLWGPGVVVYEGEHPPDVMWEKNLPVALYDPMGKPETKREVQEVTYRGSRTPVKEMIEVPVMGNFRDVVTGIDQQRLARYLTLVNEANEHIVTSEGKEKKWYMSRNTRLMAQVLFRLGRIPTLPGWALESDLNKPAEAQPKERCKSCGTERNNIALKCGQCGWPFDTLAAYEEGLIEFEHAAMHKLPIEDLKKAVKIKNERDRVRDAAMAGATK